MKERNQNLLPLNHHKPFFFCHVMPSSDLFLLCYHSEEAESLTLKKRDVIYELKFHVKCKGRL